MIPPNPDLYLYIVVPTPDNVPLDVKSVLPEQLFTLEQRHELFILLPNLRIIHMNPIFSALVSPLARELTEEGTNTLDRLKEQGVMYEYKVVQEQGLEQVPESEDGSDTSKS